MNAQIPQRGQRLSEGSWLDILTVLVAGAVFCLLLFLLFRRLFPASLWREEETMRQGSEGARTRELSYDAPAPAAPSLVATLLQLSGEVQVRYADSLSWGDAQAQLDLHEDDAVQTLTRSSALLRLETSDYIELGERSLIVFSAAATDRFAAIPAPRRGTLLAGTLAGTLGGKRNVTPFELALPGAQLTLQPDGPDAGQVRFQVNRNPDASTSISLFSGSARLAGGARSESLTGGYGVTLDEHGIVVEHRALPPAPVALAPASGSLVAYRDVPPRVTFNWTPVGKLTRYRLRVARDPELHDVLLDERVAGNSFAVSDLHGGQAYWSVSALDGWNEGPASAPQPLTIQQDVEPPRLTVEDLNVGAGGGPLVLRGHTESGARVYVQGELVEAAPNGDFQAEVARRAGAFLVVVEATDAVGNASYHSQIVTARDPERASVADTGTAP